jgi:hypothetical protein
MTEDKVSETISAVLRDRFGLYDLVEVKVRPEVDFDGEEILRATAVFNHRPERPPAASVEAIGAIRGALVDRGEGRVVILSDSYLDEVEPEEEDVG